jgi:hypothetical protein
MNAYAAKAITTTQTTTAAKPTTTTPPVAQVAIKTPPANENPADYFKRVTGNGTYENRKKIYDSLNLKQYLGTFTGTETQNIALMKVYEIYKNDPSAKMIATIKNIFSTTTINNQTTQASIILTINNVIKDVKQKISKTIDGVINFITTPPEWHTNRNENQEGMCYTTEEALLKSAEKWCEDNSISEKTLHNGNDCYRGMNEKVGAQCCYDSNGNIVNTGEGKGTFDIASPIDNECDTKTLPLLMHGTIDLLPYLMWDKLPQKIKEILNF